MTAATRAVTTATDWVASTRTERSGHPSPSRRAGGVTEWRGTTRSPPPHQSERIGHPPRRSTRPATWTGSPSGRPRAGRLDVRVTGVVDTRSYPWNRSGLPVDPIVELYDKNGTLITRVDRQWETGVELAQVSVGGGTVVYVRVLNYYANGNRLAYARDADLRRHRCRRSRRSVCRSDGATEVTQWVTAVATFNEVVQNVSSSTVRLRDLGSNQIVPASVSYDSAKREVRLRPSSTAGGSPRRTGWSSPPPSRIGPGTRWRRPVPPSPRATMRSGTSRARHTRHRSSGSRSATSFRAVAPSGSVRRAGPTGR